MSYRNHYSGSPWQQGGPPFGMSSYGQGYGNYSDYSMMDAGYSRNYGSMYGSGGGMSQMRSMGYGGPSPSRYGNDRMGGNRQVMSRGQIQRKRLPQRSPAGGPRSKRPNLGSSERRMSKPRRRRDSRGGSKGRGHDHSDDDDDTYNPEEPTDDASDIECDGYESWKDSGNEEETVSIKKENGEQNDTEADKKEEEKEQPKKFICYVCKVTCSNESKHLKHQASKSHTNKIDELLTIRRQKKTGADDEKETSDKEGKGEKRRSSRKPGNWCTVCECVFTGNFLAHRRTKEHRRKRDKKYPKCRPCRMGFSSSEEYRDHYKSEDHKNRSAEFHYLKGLISGSDDDQAAIEAPKVEPEEEKAVEVKSDAVVEDEVKVKEETNDEEAEEGKEKEDTTTADNKEAVKKEGEGKTSEEKKSRPREPRATGQSFVVSVTGYFCKLCRKFFKDGTVAKYKHCRSIMHTEAFKKGMGEALEQEEERQKLSDEQDKLDQKASDEAELAAEIQAIERSAKDAARREAAKKRAGDRGDDIEIKDSVEGDAASDEGKEDKEEDITDTKAEANGHKPDSQESGAEKEDEKGSSDDKPAEVLEESAEGDEEGDEEQEKEVTKEEVTSSPATRRGRGRGRGRKRR